MKLSDLSQKDKLTIAEYIYSQRSGVLIKNDAIKVIEVFKKHKVKEADTVKMEEFSILFLISKNIAQEDRNKIMEEYYSGKL
jgi:hypothetical protein